MRVVVTGATGLIGRALCRALGRDYDVVGLSRNASIAAGVLGDCAGVIEWDGRDIGPWAEQIEGSLAVVNLAGENVGSGRWSKSKKASILNSRLDASKAVLDAVTQSSRRPEVVIQASAVGWYGPRGDELLNEDFASGRGFLADVCRRNEELTHSLCPPDVRCVIIRTGVVLDSRGGALPRLALPFKFFLGGHPGSGRQWLPWISLTDEVRAIRFLIEKQNLDGAFNLTSPGLTTMTDFSRTLGHVLHRPAWMTLPGFALRCALGEMADLLLTGQRACPKRLLEAGFEFSYPALDAALKMILRKETT